MPKSALDQYICKIEGHGKLKIDFNKKKVNLLIDEGERLFEQLVLDRPYADAPFITARICGICPTAHTLVSISAIEKAFGVKVTDNISSLRKVLLYGQIIQSHALHLFFLAAPDYLKLTNILGLKDENPGLFKSALALKKIGDLIVESIGGRAVHPTTPVVGGFLSVPTKKELRKISREIESHIHLGLETVELFSGFKYPKLERKTEYLATQKDGKLSYLGNDTIISSENLHSTVENYTYAFKEEVRAGSQSKYATRDGHGFMVGALARIALDPDSLSPKSAFAYRKIWKKDFPTYNSFHNNVAQAIEIVHLMEKACEELEKVIADTNEIYKVGYKPKAGQGIAAIEAPRGTLYHAVKTDDQGFIKLYDIVVPTVQNLVNIEEDANWMIKNIDKSEKQITKEIEMLIRAYDPCITCSVH